MQEWSSDDKKTDAHIDIEERLSTYYGSPLPEQPLPSSSWVHLSSQLGSRRPTRRWLRPKWRIAQRRASQTPPPYIQEAFARIAFQAGMLYTTQKVQCIFKPHVVVPSIYVSLLKKRAIKLTLSTQVEHTPDQAELDVLLASGLARYTYVRSPAYRTSWLLLSALLYLLLLTTVLITSYRHNTLTPVILLLIACLCAFGSTVFWLLGLQARNMARRADKLVVQWIGREQTCRGLHALAAHSHAPSRQGWVEPSLTERINSICHTPVAVEEERFTLVR